VPIQRLAVAGAREGLERLAETLEADEPVRLEGIARVQLLLTNGDSLLYSPYSAGVLDEAVSHAYAALFLD
jgi:hypothetical protein